MKKATAAILLLLLATGYLHGQIATLEPTLELRTVDGVTVPFQNGIPMPGFEKQQRTMIPLAGAWRKERFIANDALTLSSRSTAMAALLNEAKGRESRSFDDSAWPVITLPAIENNLRGYEHPPEAYEEGVWYRRQFNVPDSLRGRDLKLIFYSVNYVADVWLNGQYLGYHEGGYTPFAFDITREADYGASNTLAIRVDNPKWGTRKDIVPFVKVDWFNYTGIIHDMYIEVSNPLHVLRAQTVSKTHGGELLVRTVVENRGETAQNAAVQLEVFKAEVTSANIGSEQAADLIGSPASFSGQTETTLELPMDGCRVWQSTLQIADPALWTPKTPNLYILRVTLRQEGKIVDQYHTQFGIRTLHTDKNKMLVNNKPVFYTAVARHEDHPDYGRSMPLGEILKDLQMIKSSIKCQFVRTAHYPNHLATYLYADRLGFGIMEEIPVWWYDDAESWNIQNNQRHIHEQMWREMIFRDYNRPSIMLWSTCNECRDVDNRKIFIERVNDELDTLYPDGRLVSQSAAADRPGAEDASQGACDVMGWTMYFGIFHGGTYSTGTRAFLDKVAAAWPDKPAICTEYGQYSGEDGSNSTEQNKAFTATFTELEQRRAVAPATGQVNQKGFLMAAIWWCVYDWYTIQQIDRDGYNSFGIYHMDRMTPKPAGLSLVNRYLPYTLNAGTTTAVELDPEPTAQPQRLTLEANYPNPFNSRTLIRAELPQAAEVRLEILNLRGEVVETLFSGTHAAGRLEATWNSRRAASGIYVARLRSGDQVACRKITLLK